MSGDIAFHNIKPVTKIQYDSFTIRGSSLSGNLDPRTEEELVTRASKGDGDAFGQLYDAFVDRVYRHIFFRVNNESEAEDLTQQVFIKAWEAIGRYKKTGTPFLAWLLKIGHNVVIDFYRSRKPEISIESLTLADRSGCDPVDVLDARLNQQVVREAIKKLNPDQQQVILMRFIEDFSYSEVAAAIGKSEGAVRVILHRGLANLKKILEEALK